MVEGEPDAAALAAEMIEYLHVVPDGGDLVADVPDWFGDYAFGGWVVAQAVAAAHADAPRHGRMHSLHAYFLRPVAARQRIVYRVRSLREGRTFVARELEASQDGRAVFAMTYSFTADGQGYEYEPVLPPDVPDPGALPFEPGPGPWVAAYLGPTPPRPDGTRESTHRAWVRVDAPLPEDPGVHAAFVAFASDWTGTGGRPLHLDGDVDGMISLDHALWFHRPLRADQWIFIDVDALVNTGGRGVVRSTLRDADRRIGASMAQEMLLRVVE